MGSKGGFSLPLVKELVKVQQMLKFQHVTANVQPKYSAVGHQHNFQGNPLLAVLTVFHASLLQPLDHDAAGSLSNI